MIKQKCSPEKFLHQDYSHQQFWKCLDRTFWKFWVQPTKQGQSFTSWNCSMADSGRILKVSVGQFEALLQLQAPLLTRQCSSCLSFLRLFLAQYLTRMTHFRQILCHWAFVYLCSVTGVGGGAKADYLFLDIQKNFCCVKEVLHSRNGALSRFANFSLTKWQTHSLRHHGNKTHS